MLRIPDRYLGWRSGADLETVTGNQLWEWFSFGRYGTGADPQIGLALFDWSFQQQQQQQHQSSSLTLWPASISSSLPTVEETGLLALNEFDRL